MMHTGEKHCTQERSLTHRREALHTKEKPYTQEGSFFSGWEEAGSGFGRMGEGKARRERMYPFPSPPFIVEMWIVERETR